MSETRFLEKCQTYIDCHLQAPRTAEGRHPPTAQLPAVTISRQAGAGGITTAGLLAAWLQERAPRSPCPWAVFHKNLVQKVLEDHHLPSRLAQFMPEDKISDIQDAMEELLGLHPPSLSLLRQTTETILHLAELGNAIIVGRAGNIITAHLRHVVHVRLVGSVDCRVERVMAKHNIGRKAALEFLKNQDVGRARYVRRNFGREVEDPLLYHLTVNTDTIELETVAEMIGQLVLKKYN